MAQTTISVAADADDAYCYKTHVTYASIEASGTFVDRSGQIDVFATRETGYYITNALLRFDTSSLPDDATISAATLDTYVNSKGDADSLSLVADWYDFGGGVSTVADWANLTTGAGALEATIASLTTSNINHITLQNVSSISLSGYTGIRLGISKLAADAAPTGFNGVQLIANEHLTIPPASLTITYATEVATVLTTRPSLRW